MLLTLLALLREVGEQHLVLLQKRLHESGSLRIDLVGAARATALDDGGDAPLGPQVQASAICACA